MDFLEINTSRKKKLKEILHNLYPEFKSIFIFNNGKVIFKKQWYSLKAKVSTALDLSLTEIPLKLSQYAENNNFQHIDVDSMVYISILARRYGSCVNLIDKFWAIYSRIKFPIKWNLLNNNILTESKSNIFWSIIKVPKEISEKSTWSNTDFKAIIKRVKSIEDQSYINSKLLFRALPASIKR